MKISLTKPVDLSFGTRLNLHALKKYSLVMVTCLSWSFSMAQVSIDFDNTSDLTNNFNPDASPQCTNISTGGLSGSGSVDIPSPTTDCWTSKTSYPLVAGNVYTASAYFLNAINSGRGGLGFAKSATNEPAQYGHPDTSVGMSFHGGVGEFMSNGVVGAIMWPPDLTLGNWYKMIFQMTYTGSNNFDIVFEIWNSDSTGALGAIKAQVTSNGIVNTFLGGSAVIYPYFSHQTSRFSNMDNFVVPNSCVPTTDSISPTACVSYASPSGKYMWTTSNTYMDTPGRRKCYRM
ncbi:MAG: hypothetical protein IIA45_12290 [Bacteroidetes bacterium]|nr:hypothetical protein [Bacteroidota bacterium]